MRIHCLQQVPFETPGNIIEWLQQNNHSISYTYFFEEEPLFPAADQFDCLLVLGGYMNVNEEEKFTWLKQEKAFIKTAINCGKKVMGICLGSQLIAAALGNRVYSGKEKEIGFFPVTFTSEGLQHTFFNHFSKEYIVFHWHGDTFDLPKESILVASTNTFINQAFIIGKNVIGLQFHLEMNEQVIEQMLIHDGHELEEQGSFIQQAAQIKSSLQYLEQNKIDMFLLLDKFFAG